MEFLDLRDANEEEKKEIMRILAHNCDSVELPFGYDSQSMFNHDDHGDLQPSATSSLHNVNGDIDNHTCGCGLLTTSSSSSSTNKCNISSNNSNNKNNNNNIIIDCNGDDTACNISGGGSGGGDSLIKQCDNVIKTNSLDADNNSSENIEDENEQIEEEDVEELEEVEDDVENNSNDYIDKNVNDSALVAVPYMGQQDGAAPTPSAVPIASFGGPFVNTGGVSSAPPRFATFYGPNGGPMIQGENGEMIFFRPSYVPVPSSSKTSGAVESSMIVTSQDKLPFYTAQGPLTYAPIASVMSTIPSVPVVSQSIVDTARAPLSSSSSTSTIVATVGQPAATSGAAPPYQMTIHPTPPPGATFLSPTAFRPQPGAFLPVPHHMYPTLPVGVFPLPLPQYYPIPHHLASTPAATVDNNQIIPTNISAGKAVNNTPNENDNYIKTQPQNVVENRNIVYRNNNNNPNKGANSMDKKDQVSLNCAGTATATAASAAATTAEHKNKSSLSSSSTSPNYNINNNHSNHNNNINNNSSKKDLKESKKESVNCVVENKNKSNSSSTQTSKESVKDIRESTKSVSMVYNNNNNNINNNNNNNNNQLKVNVESENNNKSNSSSSLSSSTLPKENKKYLKESKESTVNSVVENNKNKSNLSSSTLPNDNKKDLEESKVLQDVKKPNSSSLNSLSPFTPNSVTTSSDTSKRSWADILRK